VAFSAINRGVPPPEGLDARSLYEECVRLWRTLGDELATAGALGDLGAVCIRSRQYADASAAYAEAARICRRLGIRGGFVDYATTHAGIAQRQADSAGARSVLEGLLGAGRDLRDPFLEARGLVELACVWWAEGDHGEARRLLEEAAAIGRKLDARWALVDALHGLGALALQRDEVPLARRLFEEAAAVAQDEEPGMEDRWAMVSFAHVALADDDLEAAKDWSRKALAVGPKLKRFELMLSSSPGNRTQASAVLIDVATVLAVRHGDLQQAAVLAGAADAVYELIIPARFTLLRSVPSYQRARSAIREELGEPAFESAHAAGADLDQDELLRLVAAALG